MWYRYYYWSLYWMIFDDWDVSTYCDYVRCLMTKSLTIMLASMILSYTWSRRCHTSYCRYWWSETIYRDICSSLTISTRHQVCIDFMNFSYSTRSKSWQSDHQAGFLQIYTTSPIVVVMIVKRSISIVYLFSSVHKRQLLSWIRIWSILEADSARSVVVTLMHLSFWISVFLTSPLLLSFRFPIFDDIFIYNVRLPRVKSSRSLRHIPSNTHHHNIPPLSVHGSDFHNLQSSLDVDQCNVLLTYTLVSPHSFCASFISVVFWQIGILTCFQVDTNFFSSRSNTFVYPIIFWYQSGYPSNSGSCRLTLQTNESQGHTFLNSRCSPMYWWDRSDWFRRLNSSKIRPRRMIHNSVVVYRLEISSAFRNCFRDDLMTISSIKSSNHKNEWTTSVWNSSAKMQNFVVNFFDVSSCSLTVTSVTRSTNIQIYIYIYIEEIRLLISFHEDDRNSERTRYYNLILVSIWSELSTGSEESELLVCAHDSIQHSSRKIND